MPDQSPTFLFCSVAGPCGGLKANPRWKVLKGKRMTNIPDGLLLMKKQDGPEGTATT